jgi:CRP-like cAMP-binding protein
MSTNARLRVISLFEELSEAELARIAGACSTRTYEKGAQILGDKDRSTDVFFILDGSVRINTISPEGREVIYSELLRLAAEGQRQGKMIVIKPAPTHYEIAARIGSHREAVTREFNRLETESLLDVSRRQISILDVEKLQRAEGEG